MTETIDLNTAPVAITPDSKVMARRPGRELFPASWLRRGVRLTYEVGGGKTADVRGTLLDFCGLGLLVQINGARSLLPWERVVMVELEEG